MLEIGSGCGAVTGALCRKAKEVTCIELSMKRSRINAYRHRDQDNLKILWWEISRRIEKNLTEKYDYITLIGVFEDGRPIFEPGSVCGFPEDHFQTSETRWKDRACH